MSVSLPSNEAAVATYAWLRLCGESGRPKPNLRHMVGHASVVDIALQLVPDQEWAPWLESQQLGSPMATDLFDTPTPELVAGSEGSPDSGSDDERDETYEDVGTIDAVPMSDDTVFYDAAFPVTSPWVCSHDGQDEAACSAGALVLATPSGEPKLQFMKPNPARITSPAFLSPPITPHHSKKRPQHLKASESGRGVWPGRRKHSGIQKTGFHGRCSGFENLVTVEHVERPGCGEARWTDCLQSLVI